jgi:hypothetical protein
MTLSLVYSMICVPLLAIYLAHVLPKTFVIHPLFVPVRSRLWCVPVLFTLRMVPAPAKPIGPKTYRLRSAKPIGSKKDIVIYLPRRRRHHSPYQYCTVYGMRCSPYQYCTVYGMRSSALFHLHVVHSTLYAYTRSILLKIHTFSIFIFYHVHS